MAASAKTPTATMTSTKTKNRPWHDSWLSERSNNGEMVKAWCIRMSKKSGTVRCKYCKHTITYNTKGLTALTKHANTTKHLDNRKLLLVRLRALKTKAANGGTNKKGPATNKKSLHQKPGTNTKKSSSTPAFGSRTTKGNKLKRKTPKNATTPTSTALIKKRVRPSAAKKSSAISPSLSPKYTLPGLSKKFIQFKTQKLQKQSFLSPKSKVLPSSIHLPSHKPSHQWPAGLIKKTSASSNTKPNYSTSRYILSYLDKLTSGKSGYSTAHYSHPHYPHQLWHKSPHQPPPPHPSSSSSSLGASPVPGLSLCVGQPRRSIPDSYQVYQGSNLRATKPPLLIYPQPKEVHLIPVFVCYFCHEDFASRSCLYDHQTRCEGKMAPSFSSSSQPTNPSTASTNASTASTTTMLVDFDRSPATCEYPTTPTKQRPAPLTPLPFLSTTIPAPAPPSPHDPYKPTFLNQLGLLAKKSAWQHQKKISRKRRNTECENLDWEVDDLTPKTPCTPLTPKRLLSHLSREEHRHDGSVQRALRLSTSDLWKKEVEKMEDTKEHAGKSDEGEEDNENESNDNIKDAKHKGKIIAFRSLYNIDVTSLLGQFVVKHYKADPSIHILSDIESHCRTTTATSATKRITSCCLRARHDSFPVTFVAGGGGGGKRSLSHDDYFHTYKFNKHQVMEFMKTANTGLNKDSRQLVRRMKKCRVLLRRISKADLKKWLPSQKDISVDVKPLSAAEIAYWTTPKPTPTEDSLAVFPTGLQFSSPNLKVVLGLKSKREVCIKTVPNELPLSILDISNFVSEETSAELLENRKVIYRSLLADCPKNNSENVDISKSSSLLSSCSLLRRILNNRPIFGDLPDITNLTSVAQASAKTGPGPCLAKQEATPLHAGETTITFGKDIKDIKANDYLDQFIHSQNKEEKKSVTKDVTICTNGSSSSICDTNSKPDESSEEISSCAFFVDPKPSDLPRGEIPSPASQESPGDSSHQQALLRDRETSRKQPGKSRVSRKSRWEEGRRKVMSGHSIRVKSPSGFCDILSVENHPHLMDSFLDHFKDLTNKESRSSSSSSSLPSRSCSATDSGPVQKKGRFAKMSSLPRKRKDVDTEINPQLAKVDTETMGGGDDVVDGVVKVEVNGDVSGSGSVCGGDEDQLQTNNNRARSSSAHSSRERRQGSTANMKPRRKSSPRITKRVRINLNRRLSIAGLVKREELPSLSPSPSERSSCQDVDQTTGGGAASFRCQQDIVTTSSSEGVVKDARLYFPPRGKVVAPIRISGGRKA